MSELGDRWNAEQRRKRMGYGNSFEGQGLSSGGSGKQGPGCPLMLVKIMLLIGLVVLL